MFRERGIDAVSVSDVMQASGLTHGAFYAHFASKDALVTAAIKEAIDRSSAALAEALAHPSTAKATFLATYLSPDHRDGCAEGCPIPALAVEIGRRNSDRRTLASHIRGLIDRFVKGFRWKGHDPARDQAILMTAAMVGAVVLARAVDDEELSDEILAATRRQLL